MQCGCTSKLIDYSGVAVAPSDTSVPPVFRWSANIVTINRRRAIVVGNDASRYGFVLYGIKAKDIRNLGELMISGVRACLESACIDSGLIERYMEACGSQLLYTKLSDRSVIARLNQLCTRATRFADLFIEEAILQNHALLRINADFVTMKRGEKREYVQVEEQFATEISSYFGVHPYGCRAAEFEVKLELESTCRRRIIVPLCYTFWHFHRMLQKLFCWQGYHLHDFWIDYHEDGRLKHTLVGTPREFEMEDELAQPDWTVCLSEIFPDHEDIVYNYDFGDDWIHRIHLVRIIEDYDSKFPVLIEGEGDAPPEDIGGPAGYAHLLHVLADPEHPNHHELKTWHEGMRCAPFDAEQINRALRFTV